MDVNVLGNVGKELCQNSPLAKTPTKEIDVEKIVLKHFNDKSINPHKINPIYLKLTEAEEKLSDKKNN